MGRSSISFGSFKYLLWVIQVSPFTHADVSLPPMEGICVAHSRYLFQPRKASPRPGSLTISKGTTFRDPFCCHKFPQVAIGKKK